MFWGNSGSKTTSKEKDKDRAEPAAPAWLSNQKPVSIQPHGPKNSPPDPAAEEASNQIPLYTDLKVTLHRRILSIINLAIIDQVPRHVLRAEIGELLNDLLAEEKQLLNLEERERLTDDVIDEILGLGPLEPLLKDPDVSDILVNTYRQTFIESKGRLHYTNVVFKDDQHLLRIITKIVNQVGRRVDESQPMVDARLADGSRVNAIIPPLAVDGPLLSIRKFSVIPISLDTMVEYGTIPPELAEVMKAVVTARRNILISGGTGSGKTTTLNAMSAFISNDERIITIEDSAELRLQQFHVGRLETRPSNIEGTGEISQRDLLKNALRMRPDRIIIGEVRAGEAFDMLQAMNTGHDGSMTTIHANTARDALSRLEQMVGMSGVEISPLSIRGQIASAIQVVIQISRFSDGRRRLVSLSEIVGMEGDVITLQDIFNFRQEDITDDGKVIGHFVATGIRPKFCTDLESRGIKLSPALFDSNRRLKAVI